MNDPVTSRFRGRFRIADGWAHLSAASDSGPLAFYDAGAKHVLAGTVSGPRADGRTAMYVVYLERDARATSPRYERVIAGAPMADV